MESKGTELQSKTRELIQNIQRYRKRKNENKGLFTSFPKVQGRVAAVCDTGYCLRVAVPSKCEDLQCHVAKEQ
jgi:hypothetical protein